MSKKKEKTVSELKKEYREENPRNNDYSLVMDMANFLKERNEAEYADKSETDIKRAFLESRYGKYVEEKEEVSAE